MARETSATPGVYRRERSAASRSSDVACTPSLPPTWTRKTSSLGSKSWLVGNALMLEHLVRKEKKRAGALTGGTVPGVWPANSFSRRGLPEAPPSHAGVGPPQRRGPGVTGLSGAGGRVAGRLEEGVDDPRVVLVAETEVDPLDCRLPGPRAARAGREVLVRVRDLDDAARQRDLLAELAHLPVRRRLVLEDVCDALEHTG